MTASDQMRAMLDQLMGTARDGEKPAHNCKFSDPKVCKSFLLECCPHDLLANTRMDLGECPKIHDIALRADYHHGQKTRDYFYDIDAMEHLEKFIIDCDHKTEMAKKRLKETQEELSEEAAAQVNVIHGYGEQIGTKLAKAEELGAAGNVDESLRLMEEVEDLKRQKQTAENDYRNCMPASNYQQQKLRVCEVCSAYLGIHDNDRRLADHFGGRLHVGFITLRAKLQELKQSVEERKLKRDKEREERRRELNESGDGERSKRSTSRRRSRTPDRRRSSKTPDRRRRSRTPDRRRRSRTPDRKRGSRSPERRRRSRTPDRRRHEDRERRSSKDRDRERRRSRSGDRRHRDSTESSRRRRSSRERRSRSKSPGSRSKSRRSRSRSPSGRSSAHKSGDGKRSGSRSKSHRDGSREKSTKKSPERSAKVDGSPSVVNEEVTAGDDLAPETIQTTNGAEDNY